MQDKALLEAFFVVVKSLRTNVSCSDMNHDRRSNTTNNFVAAIVEAGDWLHQECPEQCRPREHRDWTMC